MPRKGLSREGLKWIACITMLIDHIGAVFLSGYGLRLIGRISFPIYCFLLAEGARYTHSIRRYAARLAVVAVLSEVPYDLLFYGGIDWQHQNVMITLLLGLLSLAWAKKARRFPVIPLVVCAALAEICGSDYGCWGVLLIWHFAIPLADDHRVWPRLLGMVVIFLLMGSVRIPVLGIPIQLFGLLSILPIGLYSGEKAASNRWVQRAFYLFYPVHLLILLGVSIYV